MNRRVFLKTVAATGAGAGTGALTQRASARDRLRVTRHRVAFPGGGPVRIVHLTDLHVGRATSSRVLRRAVKATWALRPQLTVLTGDYLNRTLRYLPQLTHVLAALPRPCVATLGNHDYWSGADEIARRMQRLGILVLRNEHRLLRLRGRLLPVVGVDDGRTGRDDVPRAFHGLVRPRHALVLTHYPNTAEPIMAQGGRLVLAGHTHGGQIAIPKLTGALARASGNRYLAGWFRIGPGRLFVSAGLGSAAIPLRLGRTAVPEVAVLDLV